MKDESPQQVIDLDPNELLGLSQLAGLSPANIARLLSKVGGETGEGGGAPSDNDFPGPNPNE